MIDDLKIDNRKELAVNYELAMMMMMMMWLMVAIWGFVVCAPVTSFSGSCVFLYLLYNLWLRVSAGRKVRRAHRKERRYIAKKRDSLK